MLGLPEENKRFDVLSWVLFIYQMEFELIRYFARNVFD